MALTISMIIRGAVVPRGRPGVASNHVYTTTGAGPWEYVDGPSDDVFTLDNYSAGGSGVIRSSGGRLLSWNYVSEYGDSVTRYRDLAKGKDYFMRVCLASGPGDTTPINCAGKVIRDN